MVERDSVLAVLQSGIALAGLLLIFSGFLFSKAESFSTKRGDKFKLLAKLTLVPVLVAIALSWASVLALEGDPWSAIHLVMLLKITLAVTAVFAIVGIIAGSP